MLDEMPGREWCHRDEPRVCPKARKQHEKRDEDERVLDEVDPLDVERANDSQSTRAGKMQHMDLDHLRDVFDKVRGLGEREEAEEHGPPRRDEPVGMRRRARGHS